MDFDSYYPIGMASAFDTKEGTYYWAEGAGSTSSLYSANMKTISVLPSIQTDDSIIGFIQE